MTATRMDGMIELLPDIFHTDSDRPFANTVETRAYLVTLAAGNFLFYSSSLIEQEFDFIRSKGGILKQYLKADNRLQAGVIVIYHRLIWPQNLITTQNPAINCVLILI